METDLFLQALPAVINNLNYFRKMAAIFISSKTHGIKVALEPDDIVQETICRLLENKRKWIAGCQIKTQFINHLKSVAENEINTKYHIKDLGLRKIERVDNPINELDKKIMTESILYELKKWADKKSNKEIKLVLQQTLEGYNPQEIAKERGVPLSHIKYLKNAINKRIIKLQKILVDEK